VKLSDQERAMLDGHHGEALRRSMEGLVQLGEAFGAEDMVRLGYAHVHPGMALYARDVELLEELVSLGAKVSVPTSANVTNVDSENWKLTGAPEKLVRVHRRGVRAHTELGCVSAMTCTPYWAGHWPTWNMHMTSIESGVTVFCNSVLGARSNRDGFFSVYAAIAGRYPRFGYHLDEHRVGSHLVRVEAPLENVSDFTCLGFHVGRIVGSQVPVFTGFNRRPTLDELDGLGAGLATTGSVSMFIVPQITPPFATVEQAFKGRPPVQDLVVRQCDIDAVYEGFDEAAPGERVDFVHLGCPHASFEELREYGRLFAGRTAAQGVELWITTSRAVRALADQEGITAALRGSGAKIITDTCPMSCHFARTTSPDPDIVLPPPPMRVMVVDSAKQAKYVRDMIRCKTLLTSTAAAVETAVTGRFVPRHAA
jgi:cis-L-3-hydroxyproline dehydratase